MSVANAGNQFTIVGNANIVGDGGYVETDPGERFIVDVELDLFFARFVREPSASPLTSV